MKQSQHIKTKDMGKFTLSGAILLCCTLTAFTQALTFEKTSEGAWVKENGEKVFFYQAKTKSLDGAFSRADYIHPLCGLDGFELTEDFPKDHLHHRGIFWTWHQVIIGDKHIGDAWECRDFVWDVKEVTASSALGDALTLKTKTYWQSPLWLDKDENQKPFVEENTNITVYPRAENYRVIDFEISLVALEPDLKIGGSDDEKGYSGFSVRMKMPDDIVFLSEHGEVQPTINQLRAGPWMDVSGSLAADGSKAGIVMICHPDNPVYPDPWIIRKNGSMQNPAFPGRQPVAVSNTTPMVLRYRLVIYKGDITPEEINGIQNQFGAK